MWFSLKDPAVLPMTVFLDREPRTARRAHWDGRNRCLGAEDVLRYFADGLVPVGHPERSQRAGVKTAHVLSGDEPFVPSTTSRGRPGDYRGARRSSSGPEQ